MANRTVPAERLREGSIIVIKGKLAFSRLAKVIDGQALADSVARQRAQGRLYPTDKPHTTVSLVDVELLPENPAALTPEEIFVQESIYVSKQGENAGRTGYNIDNVGTSLPPVLELDPATGTYSQVEITSDLDTGLEVMLVLNVFKPKSYEKRGIGISQVLVNEPIRYYSGGMSNQALAARGIVISGEVRPVTSPSAQPLGEAAPAGVPAGSVVTNGLTLPGPGTPVQPVQQYAPAPAAPVQQYAPAPVQPVQPVQQYAPAPAQPVQQYAPAPVETDQQRSARLEAELAALRAAQAGSGGASAFDPAPQEAPQPAAAGASPWDQPAGIRYQG